MSGRPSFGKMILLIASGVALAFFGCLGAITGGSSGPRVAVGGTGFVAGLILILVGLYYALVRFIDRVAPPSQASAGSPSPPAHYGSTGPDGGEPPQKPEA